MPKPLPRAPEAPPGSLAALAEVPDSRKPYGWLPAYPPIPLVALLQMTVAAVLCGARSLNAVAQWGRERAEDDPALLEALGLPPGRSPCVATLHRVLKALDVAAFEAAVGAWLARTGVAPTDPVAIDGKTLRGSTARGCRGSIWCRPTRTGPAPSWPICAAPGTGTSWPPPRQSWARCRWPDGWSRPTRC